MRLITGSLSRRNLGRGATAILLSGVLLTSGCGGESDASQAKIPPEGTLTAGLRNEWDKVERVLDRMDDVDVRVTTGRNEVLGRTLLMMAAYADEADMVGKLLERGADPQARDAMHRTPLHFATETCNLELVTLLLRAGGTLNARDQRPFRQRTPLDLAAHCPVPFIEALIAEGGDPCDADAEGRNLACYAAIAGTRNWSGISSAPGRVPKMKPLGGAC